MWLGRLLQLNENLYARMKERIYLSYDSRSIKVVKICKTVRDSLVLVVRGGWERGRLNLSTGTSVFSNQVLQRVITRSRLRGYNRLGFRYHVLHAASLSIIVSLRNIQVCGPTALTCMIAVVGVTSRDFLGEPAWDTQSERTPASQRSETWGPGCAI